MLCVFDRAHVQQEIRKKEVASRVMDAATRVGLPAALSLASERRMLHHIEQVEEAAKERYDDLELVKKAAKKRKGAGRRRRRPNANGDAADADDDRDDRGAAAIVESEVDDATFPEVSRARGWRASARSRTRASHAANKLAEGRRQPRSKHRAAPRWQHAARARRHALVRWPQGARIRCVS